VVPRTDQLPDERRRVIIDVALEVFLITPVCQAAPGIRTFLDLPTIVGRGVLS
jgi:hypothetical protein